MKLCTQRHEHKLYYLVYKCNKTVLEEQNILQCFSFNYFYIITLHFIGLFFNNVYLQTKFICKIVNAKCHFFSIQNVLYIVHLICT